MKRHCYFVYIMASKSRVLYTGMCSSLERRVFQHKHEQKYRCHRLVYFESFDDVNRAINREKQIKRWSRAKKMWLIERRNPAWEDLAAEWYVRHRYQPDEQQVPRLRDVPPESEHRSARDDSPEGTEAGRSSAKANQSEHCELTTEN